MRRIAVPLPWVGVSARAGAFGIPGTESRLSPPMRRVHQSRCARALAIELLDERGRVVSDIPKGAAGEPVWPAGVVGSLAHTEHYAVAVIAEGAACAALGVDIEPALPLPGETADLILGTGEQAWANAHGRDPSAGRLLFCAKECVHKAIHPLTDIWLDFLDVRIHADLETGRFGVEPLSEPARRAFAGRRAEGVVLRLERHWVPVLAVF